MLSSYLHHSFTQCHKLNYQAIWPKYQKSYVILLIAAQVSRLEKLQMCLRFSSWNIICKISWGEQMSKRRWHNVNKNASRNIFSFQSSLNTIIIKLQTPKTQFYSTCSTILEGNNQPKAESTSISDMRQGTILQTSIQVPSSKQTLSKSWS